MGSSIFSWLYFSIFAATYFHVSRGYVLSSSCWPYSHDIAIALEDAVQPLTLAHYSLITNERRGDWFGLINLVFPGVMDTWPTAGYYDLGTGARSAVHPLPQALASHQVLDSSSSDSEQLYWDYNVEELVSS